MCYYCGSTDRERLLYVYLFETEQHTQIKKMRILHIAPENNLYSLLKGIINLEYVAGDKFMAGYENAYPPGVVDLDIRALPFENNFFDLIICNHVLEHIEEDARAMTELYRVLKIGGRAILQVPIGKNLHKTYEDFSIVEPSEREIHFGQDNHVRIYGQDYTKRLQLCGFDTERSAIAALPQFAEYGLNPDEILFIGRKNRL